MLKKIIAVFSLAVISLISWGYYSFKSIKETLPKIESIQDYEPLLVSQVFDRNKKKIGEFSFQRRILVPYEKIPKNLVNAFLAAEDDQFFHHSGINFQAILRATFANIKAGKSVQGGSTISQQVAKTFFLSPEKTLMRKAREALLALQIEEKLAKEEILYLYLNQIYFGQGAYGIEAAAQTYFHKSVGNLSLSEMAILAGLPKAPSSYSPVRNPNRAKERQVYVLRRMGEVNFLKKEDVEKAMQEPVHIYINENYDEYAPHYLEAVRQILRDDLGEDLLLKKGLMIYTSLDLDKQRQAQQSIEMGLKNLDKRQGFRGPLGNLSDEEEQNKYLAKVKTKIIQDLTSERTILPSGHFAEIVSETSQRAHPNLPPFLQLNMTYEGIVEKVSDAEGMVTIKLPDAKGVIPFESMRWARRPDPSKKSENNPLMKLSEALKVGDIILARIIAPQFEMKSTRKTSKNGKIPPVNSQSYSNYLSLELDQNPNVEGALISYDQETEDILAMVGGFKFERKKNEFNRAIQAARQSGSIFKSIIYASALDHGMNPSSLIMDVPLVFEEKVNNKNNGKTSVEDNDGEGQTDETKIWKPSNHSKSFSGDITFRNALVQSLNAPAVRVMEEVGVKWGLDYGRRLGIFSPLNEDLTLVLGSSSVTLYEMTKVFSEFGRLGKRLRPKIILKITDRFGKEIKGPISMDVRFSKEIKALDDEFEKRREEFLKITDPTVIAESKKLDKFIFFSDPDQIIRPQTAYVMTSLLKGVIDDPNGTGARARALGRDVAGKTGSSSDYFDAWFIGYTPQIATGVWVGFDKEQTLGLGEVGGRSALPIWLSYMKEIHQKLPEMTFPVPEGIVFANIDADTGRLASARSRNIIRQAYIEGTEPTSSASETTEEKNNFYKQDLNE